jgi:iron complex outermembrane receptor protein
METTWEWPYWDRETVSFVSSTNFGSFYVKPRVFYDQYGNGLYGWGGNDYLSRYDDYAWGGSLEAGKKDEHNTLKVKFDYKFNQHEASDVTGHDGGFIDGTDRKYNEHIFFFAVEDTYRFNEHWEVQGGLLYSLQHADLVIADAGRNTGDLNAMFPEADIGKNPTNFGAWGPQAILLYNLNKEHAFHYSIARKTLFPSMRNRFSNYGSGDLYYSGACSDNPCPLVTLPNPDLKPEQALHHEIGWTGNFFDRLNIDLDWYYSRHNNLISRPSADTTTYPGFAVQQVVNVPGDTRRQGFDLGIEYIATDRIMVGTSFSYLHSFNRDTPEWRSTASPYHGAVYASIGLNEWAALIPALDYTGRSRVGSTGVNRWNFNEGYAMVDLKLSITPPMYRNISINIGAENLFNKDYRNWANRPQDNYRALYPTPGRYLYANVRYKL